MQYMRIATPSREGDATAFCLDKQAELEKVIRLQRADRTTYWSIYKVQITEANRLESSQYLRCLELEHILKGKLQPQHIYVRDYIMYLYSLTITPKTSLLKHGPVEFEIITDEDDQQLEKLFGSSSFVFDGNSGDKFNPTHPKKQGF